MWVITHFLVRLQIRCVRPCRPPRTRDSGHPPNFQRLDGFPVTMRRDPLTLDSRGGRLGSRHAVALQLMVWCGTAPLPSFTLPQPVILIATMGGCPSSRPKAVADTPSRAIAAITMVMTSHRIVP